MSAQDGVTATSFAPTMNETLATCALPKKCTEMPNETDLEHLQSAFLAIRQQLAKAVVSQDAVIEQMMIALLAGGHCLYEGPPGAAKSLAAASLARVLGLRFDRVRSTAESTPRDIVGLGAGPTGSNEVAGPIFANVVLVDDFARLPVSSDALIHQAIQENRIVLDGRRHHLPEPFMILATRYPEVEAADSIVEHHDDRFMMKIAFSYPAYDEEFALTEKLTSPEPIELEQVVGPIELAEFRRVTSLIATPPHVIHYALRLIRATRVHEGETPDFVYEWVDFGAGPRAAHHLTLAAKIRAGLYGRAAATADDIKAVTPPILRHRIITNSNARSTGVTVDRVIRRLLYEIEERQEGDEQAPADAED